MANEDFTLSNTGKPQNFTPNRALLKDFVSSFVGDPAKSNQFEVRVFVPPLYASSSVATPQRLTLRCDSASLPGRTIQTQDLKIYGPIEKLPYQTSYEDITLSFICSTYMLEKNLFDFWLDYINPSESWNFKFRNNYCTNILITQFDNTKNFPTHQISLIDAYPVSVAPLQLDWAAEGFHKLDVTFAYTYWQNISMEDVKETSPTISKSPNSYVDNLETILKTLALAKDVHANLGKNNPYGLLSTVGAAASLFGGDKKYTLSYLLNNRGVKDTLDDRNRINTTDIQGSSISDVSTPKEY